MRRALAWCLWRDLRALASYRLATASALVGVLFQVGLFWFVSRLVPPGQGALRAHGGDFFSFLVLGVLGFRLTGAALHGPSQAVQWEAVQGTLEPGLQSWGPARLLLGGSAHALGFRLLEAVAYLAAGWLAGLSLRPTGAAAAALALLLGVLAHLGAGLAGAGFVLGFQRGNPVAGMLGAAQAFVAGVWFPPELLPGALAAAAAWLPLAVTLRLLRRSLHGLPCPAADWAAALAWALGALLLGRLCLAAGLARARREGTLGQF